MDIISELKQEHREIERELIELEEIIDSENVNYPNFVHTFNKLLKIWNLHEEKEEILFPFLENSKQNIKIPVEKMLFEHRILKPHKEIIVKAIDSGSEYEMKKCLKENATIIIVELRNHIDFEDEILYTSASEELTREEVNKLWDALIWKNGE